MSKIEHIVALATGLEKNHDISFRLAEHSRALTKASKRLIQSLHRGTDPASVLHAMRSEYQKFFESIKDIDDIWRYYNSIRQGLEEYLECVGFYYYITQRRLATLDEFIHECNGVPINSLDIINAISDASGEIMRKVTSQDKNTNDLGELLELCVIFSQWACISSALMPKNKPRWLIEKIQSMRTNAQKIEKVAFTSSLLQIRPRHHLVSA